MIDFLVIGGGIAGISAGARLSALGQVTVLEAEIGLGYHTSGRSAAMFDQIFGLPTTTEMNRASRDYHMTENGGVLSPQKWHPWKWTLCRWPTLSTWCQFWAPK